ncbi:alkaline phosphatase family protein [Acuticoccus sp. I52.16.1]|uniref:alkaline phosphatase family protein n=1 Tax=Acuticoccus sp. I52.16.1 TaxID=2928472 RepID=UPI001FD5A412|nr:alkaline phosphatase family protein [Acuticoccus sp. I52.16.1]UOM36260.1 alkaline phosphatase family protein [Acuticoccus sp. I52.16.1]
MTRAFAIVLDGLRRDLVTPETTPHLMRFADTATRFTAHRSVFPSATRVVSAAFATGCHPARNGLQGNTVALMANGRLALHDVGKPEFFATKRAATGSTLDQPTMAERLSDRGGVVVFNNVSPGAAYAHDPDGHGTVYHRAGSHGPGLGPVARPLAVTLGIDGDEAMAERFVAEAVDPAGPHGRTALAVLWLSEPDTTQHAAPLGSPDALAVLRRADAVAGRVLAAIDAAHPAGPDAPLVAILSDHGHQTVGSVIDIDAFLVAEGLKAKGADDVLVAPNGTGALVYVHPDGADRIPAIVRALEAVPWTGAVYAGEELARVGHAPVGGLAVAVSMAASDAPNAYGIRGTSAVVRPCGSKADRLGCGQHGGLGAGEQSPFLMMRGAGFRPGAALGEPTSAVDLAPTILTHLGVPHRGLDGRDLHATLEPIGDQRP